MVGSQFIQDAYHGSFQECLPERSKNSIPDHHCTKRDGCEKGSDDVVRYFMSKTLLLVFATSRCVRNVALQEL